MQGTQQPFKPYLNFIQHVADVKENPMALLGNVAANIGNMNESEKEFCSRLIHDLENLIEIEGAENIGAFIAEPLMGAGGVIIPPKSYFEMIQPILKRNEILFIADEVISGFGRTGNMWGSQTFNIKPDIITCAKGLSSAYAPISAVLMLSLIHI